MSLSSARNYALRASKSQDQKEAAELLSKAILELATSIEATDAKIKKINKSSCPEAREFPQPASICRPSRLMISPNLVVSACTKSENCFGVPQSAVAPILPMVVLTSSRASIALIC